MSDTWKAIKVPRALYLPVDNGQGFKDSGKRIEPTDTVEFLMGSTRIRINGVEHTMMRACDEIPLDKNGCIALAKPKGVTISGNGVGRAHVGREGEARAGARRMWDPQAAEEWQGDQGTAAYPSGAAGSYTDLFGKIDHFRGFRVVRDDTPAYGHTGKQASFSGSGNRPGVHMGPGSEDLPDREWSAEEQAVIDEFNQGLEERYAETRDFEYREVNLRDGSVGRALFSKITGDQVGAPSRMYQDGRSLTVNPKKAHEEYRRLMAEQNQDASVAPNAAERYEQAQAKNASRTLHGEPPRNLRVQAPQEVPRNTPAPEVLIPHTVALGHQILDGAIAHAFGLPSTAYGIPLGEIIAMSGEGASAVLGTVGAVADSLTNAVGRLFMLKDSEHPMVSVTLGDMTDINTRIALADDFPRAVEALKKARAVLVLVLPSPEVPGIVSMASKVHVHIEPHERDERFLVATINGKTTAFPHP